MARFLGNVSTPLTYKVNSQSALDPRVVVDIKEELTKAETWPSSGESVYVYDGQIVYVKSEQCAYALVDKNNYTDVNSWKYVGGYEDIYAYDIKLEAIQDASKIFAGKLTFDMISNTTTVSGIYYDENNNYFYRTVQIGGATGSVETRYYLAWGDLGDNIIASEILGDVKDDKTYPKDTTYYCEYQDADGKQDFIIPSLDFNGFVPGKLYISVLNGKMYKASSADSLITVSGGDSSYLLNRLIALEKAGAEDDVLEFNGMVDTEDIVESSVAANNYTIAFDTYNKQFVAYENGVYYANWKENDFNKPSAAYGEKMYSGIKPTAGKIYIDISTNQIYRWNGVDLIALNATADSIKIGKNDDGNTYKIALNSDGSGHLANKGIEWNAEGDVTFGQNVTLNWSNIENPPTPPAGEGTFKSTVFTRNNATPDTPTGGSYNNPKPDGNIWSDGIPDGDEILWASTRVFSTLGEDSELEQKAWTDPKKMTDTASFNVEFSSLETPATPTDFEDGETEEQWRAKNPDWENTSDEDTIWMATNTRKNGVWDGWQVSKIKGEKGDNGTSISIKKKANIVESIEKLPTSATIGDICFVGSIEDMDAVVLYVYQENDWVAQTGMQLGDSYLVDEWLFMWDGDSWIKSQFKGDPGKSSYIHIKYANSSNPGDWTGRGNEPSNSIIPDDKTSWGETPGAYMGVYSDNIETDSKNWNSYKWTKWEGQDGMGYEYVYRTTTTNKAPELSENEYIKNEITYNPSNDGFIPENWSDDPISISSDNPFCWMAVRQKLDGKWSSFKISLWSKWGSDSIKLDLDNDNDSIMYRDNTPISKVVSKATLYDGVTPVTTGVVYSIADWGTTGGSLDKNQITITSIGSSSTSVKIRAEYKENEYFATLSIKKLVNTDKYEIICSPNAIPHNIDEGDSQHTILVNTYKTDFETGKRKLLTKLPKGYALICNINDSNSGNDNVTIVNNQYILDITDTNKPDSLTFILKKGEEVLDSETIPVNYTKNGEKGADGKDGKDGEDGIGVSSIKTQYAISNDPINHPDDADENWEDNSPAVNKDSQYLWQRLKTIYTNNTESAWSYNVVGRMGEKGIDGDSVEYVYSRTNENKAPQKPTGTEPIENNNGTWTDDPQGVSDTNKYEWISEHKKVGGVWQEYSEPSLWAKWGEDGISPNSAFKSTVFTRTNETPSLPTGGSYDNPKPDGDIWTDGIPDGEEILWASTRIFSTDGKAPQQAKWADPRKMTDTSDFDVEYSSKESPNKPSGHPNTNTDDWSNTANEETIWMATSTCKNGVWSDWKVSKIKGEKGEDGQSIKVAGHYKDLAAFEAVWKKDGQWVAPENTSDCYVVGTNLYVWDGDSWEDVGPFKGDKGEKGDTYILYVRYSASPNGTDMSTVPNKYIGVASSKETTAPTSPSDYTWTKWKGDDGYGYDYIYIRTKSSDTEDVPALPNIDNWENNQDYQKDTYIPENWSDDPQDVDKDNPYCWMCYRQKVDGVWQQYKGSATNPGKPSLWTRWAKDGAGIESVTRKYLITAATDENGNDITIEKIKELYGPTNAAWQLNSPAVNSEKPLLVEWIHTEYTTGGTDEDYAFIGRMGEKGIDGSLIEYIYILTKTTDEIPTVPENGSESINTNNKEEWTDDPQSVDSTFKYQWISEREFDRANNKWGDYSNPVLWSIWAEDGKPGQNSIKIDLDNDNDSMLYDGSNNCISGNVISNVSLYDGSVKVSNNNIKWYLSNSNGINISNSSAISRDGYIESNTPITGPNGTYKIVNAGSYFNWDGTNYSIKICGYVYKNDVPWSNLQVYFNDDKSVINNNIGVNGSVEKDKNQATTNSDGYFEYVVDNDFISKYRLTALANSQLIGAYIYPEAEEANVYPYMCVYRSESANGKNDAWITTDGKVTVTGVTETSNYVQIKGEYPIDSNKYYYTNLSIKKLVGIDKYDLAITPNSIAYNTSTTELSSNTINIGVYRTSQSEGRKLVTDLGDLTLEINNPNVTNPDATEVYNLRNKNNTTDTSKFNISITSYIPGASDIGIVLKDSNGVVLDSETIPINKSKNGEPGQNSIKLDLDNENDSMLYDGAGNCISGDIIVTPTLYDGIDKKTPTKWEVISGESDSKNYSFDNNTGVLTVKGITDNNALYTIKATYNQKEYISVFSVKKLIGIDKFELSVTPNSITYNTSTAEPSSSDVYIGIYRTSQSEGRKLVTNTSIYGLKLYLNDSTTSGISAYNSANATNETGISKYKYTIDSDYLQKNNDVKFTLTDSNGVVLDSETIPINKSKDGSNSVSIIPSPRDIVAKKSTSDVMYTVDVSVMDGANLVENTNWSIVNTYYDTSSKWYTVAITNNLGQPACPGDPLVSNLTYDKLTEPNPTTRTINLKLAANASVETYFSFDIKYNDVIYNQKIDFKTLADGDNGNNAVTYEIVPDISYFTKAADNSSASGRIGGFVYKIDGNSRTRIKSDVLTQYQRGSDVSEGKLYIAAGYCDDDGSFKFIHNPSVDSSSSKNGRFDTSDYFVDMVMNNLSEGDNRRGLIVSNSITLELRDSNNAVLTSFNVSAAKNGMAGTPGKQSAPLRVSEWSKDNTTYYTGYEEGAPWSDTVHYNGQYYRCILAHPSNINNGPGTGPGNTYWREFDGTFQSVATGLLLAEQAYIENLIAAAAKSSSLYTNEKGEKVPCWAINADGSGYFANGKISWDTDGNLVLPTSYTLTASNMDMCGTELRVDFGIFSWSKSGSIAHKVKLTLIGEDGNRVTPESTTTIDGDMIMVEKTFTNINPPYSNSHIFYLGLDTRKLVKKVRLSIIEDNEEIIGEADIPMNEWYELYIDSREVSNKTTQYYIESVSVLSRPSTHTCVRKYDIVQNRPYYGGYKEENNYLAVTYNYNGSLDNDECSCSSNEDFEMVLKVRTSQSDGIVVSSDTSGGSAVLDFKTINDVGVENELNCFIPKSNSYTKIVLYFGANKEYDVDRPLKLVFKEK